jgi:type IV pilus assembly protein PilW
MSLVEVLVAVAIGMIGILVITQAYIATDNFNRSTLGEGSAQTSGTIALFTIERDVRMAGYGMSNTAAYGCGKVNWYYDPNYSSNLGGTLPDITLAPVTITTTPGQPDQITTIYSSSGRPIPGKLSKTMPAASSELDVDGTTGYRVQDLVLLVNNTAPVSCTMAQITQVQPSAAKIQHNPGGNAPYNPPGAGLFPAYKQDDLVFDLGNPRIRTFSVVNGRLRVTDALLLAGGAAPFDIAEGVVDLRAEYGKDNGVNNGTVSSSTYAANDGVIDSYDNVTPTSAAGWQQVLAIRMAVLTRVDHYEKPSVSGGNCDATTVLPTWSGSGASPFDSVDIATVTSQARCFHYRVFETVVPLRNVIWKIS